VNEPVNQPADWQPRTVTYALPFHRPLVTWILLAAILVVFGLELLAGGSMDTEVLVRLGAKVTPLIADGQYWRLFTAMFLHIGVFHLLFNCYALFAIGTELERVFGPLRFALVYFLSGLMGSLASYAFSYTLSAGASGAIFGVIGALAAFFLLYRDRLGAWGRARLGNIAFLIALNLFLGFTRPGIDNLGHIGGLVGGLGLGWALAPRYRLDATRGTVLDLNRPARHVPALLVAVLVLVAGTALATQAHRDDPRLHLSRGRDALQREAWDEAAAEFEQALAQDPSLGDVSTYFFLGLAYNQLDQPERAAQAYEAGLALDPRDGPSHWNLALTYFQLERHAEALEHFRAYLALHPEDAERVQPYINALERRLPGG
jgi:rhomboid protease GluP